MMRFFGRSRKMLEPVPDERIGEHDGYEEWIQVRADEPPAVWRRYQELTLHARGRNRDEALMMLRLARRYC